MQFVKPANIFINSSAIGHLVIILRRCTLRLILCQFHTICKGQMGSSQSYWKVVTHFSWQSLLQVISIFLTHPMDHVCNFLFLSLLWSHTSIKTSTCYSFSETFQDFEGILHRIFGGFEVFTLPRYVFIERSVFTSFDRLRIEFIINFIRDDQAIEGNVLPCEVHLLLTIPFPLYILLQFELRFKCFSSAAFLSRSLKLNLDELVDCREVHPKISSLFWFFGDST